MNRKNLADPNFPEAHRLHAFSFLTYRERHYIQQVCTEFKKSGQNSIDQYNREFNAHLLELKSLMGEPHGFMPLFPIPPEVDAVTHYRTWIVNHRQLFFKQLENALCHLFGEVLSNSQNPKLARHTFFQLLQHALIHLEKASVALRKPLPTFTFSNHDYLEFVILLLRHPQLRLHQNQRVLMCRLALQQSVYRASEQFDDVISIADPIRALTHKDFTQAFATICYTVNLREKIRKLLAHDADPNFVIESESEQYFSETIFACVVRSGSFDNVRKILQDAKPDTNATDRDGLTVLCLIIQSVIYSPDQKLQLVTLLLQRGADPNSFGKKGPPHNAHYYAQEHPEIRDLLSPPEKQAGFLRRLCFC